MTATARPTPGGSNNTWGQELNDWLDENLALVFNVKGPAYGALGDGVADDYAAIMRAYNAIPATGGILYFPPGTYRFGTALSFTTTVAKPLMIVGAGHALSVLAPTFSTGDAITLTGDGNSRFSVKNISVEASGTRSQDYYNLKIASGSRVIISGVTMDSQGGLFRIDSCFALDMSDCQGDSRDGSTTGATCLRLSATSGNVSNCYFRTGTGMTGYTNAKPCLWITGTTTSLGFSNCTFTGAGPASQYTVSTITSDAAKFTVTTTATHDFRVGDFVVLRGNTPTSYNSQWRVATVPTGTTFTVTSTLNPGSATVKGTAESVAAAGYVSNADVSGSAASVNECRFDSCLFEANQTGLYGSAGLYFDGRRSLNGTQAGVMSAHTLTGNYFDQYGTGLLISGMSSNSSNEPTVSGFTISGGASNARCRAIHLDQVQGIVISGVSLVTPGAITPFGDGLALDTGIYIYAGPSAPYTQGINITGNQIGAVRNWQSTNNLPYWRGLTIDGPGIADLLIVGNQIIGRAEVPNGGIAELNNPYASTPVGWTIKANEISSFTFPPTASTLIPSVSSATTISFTNIYQDVIKITGTTNIQTINNGWAGRELTLIFTGALSLTTAGNLAIGANRTVLAGDAIKIVFDGTSWYVR